LRVGRSTHRLPEVSVNLSSKNVEVVGGGTEKEGEGKKKSRESQLRMRRRRVEKGKEKDSFETHVG